MTRTRQMRQRSTTLAMLLGLGLTACLDFSGELAHCRDAGRCDGAPGGSGGGSGGGEALGPSATTSTITVTPSVLPRDGVTAASVTVTVRGSTSQPLTGQGVTLVYTGSGTIRPPVKATDEGGVATFSVTSDVATTGVLIATVNPGPNQVALTERPALSFTDFFAIAGTVTDLEGDGLVLADPTEPDLALDAGASAFAFIDPLPLGTPYSVTVKRQPSAQRCSVDHGTGVVSDGGVVSVSVSCVSTWAMVAAGASHSLGIKTDGSLWTWGLNEDGQLGDGTRTDENRPQRIGSGFAFVAAGWSHSLAITNDGGLWAWGYNHSGPLGVGFFTEDGGDPGDGGTPTSSNPFPTFVGDGYRAAVGGLNFSIFFRRDGTTWAAGSNGVGQLGTGGPAERFYLPVYVADDFVFASSLDLHTVALKADGGLFAWGFNYDGEMGPGTDAGEVFVPVQVPGTYAAAAAGDSVSYGITTDGTLMAWGSNQCGELGLDPLNTGGRVEPGPVGSGFTTVAAGDCHGLALTPEGTVWSWGSCDRAQLGTGCDAGIFPTPAPVGAGYVAISGGGGHSFGLKHDGTLWAWGSNRNGELGIGADGGLFALPVLVR